MEDTSEDHASHDSVEVEEEIDMRNGMLDGDTEAAP